MCKNTTVSTVTRSTLQKEKQLYIWTWMWHLVRSMSGAGAQRDTALWRWQTNQALTAVSQDWTESWFPDPTRSVLLATFKIQLQNYDELNLYFIIFFPPQKCFFLSNWQMTINKNYQQCEFVVTVKSGAQLALLVLFVSNFSIVSNWQLSHYRIKNVKQRLSSVKLFLLKLAFWSFLNYL